MDNTELKVGAFLVAVVILIMTVSNYYQWQAIKKFYPDVTWGEYIFLSDKLKILPEYQR